MGFPEIYHQFLAGLRQTGWLEYTGVFFGIGSVWFSRKENILVYPVGLVNTIIYFFLSLKGHLIGEAGVQIYYTAMSIYGWWLWTRKDRRHHPVVVITRSTTSEQVTHILFFSAFYIVIFIALLWLKKFFVPGAIPWADALASATAFTGMWLMAKKKLENWYWWIGTNIVSIPLYFVKNYVFTSVYYLVLLAMAFWGLAEWKKKLANRQQSSFNSH
ncbi:MAG: nicotinamide riboside transporter PnuC [Chitinophagaceae bacterium]